MGVPLDVKEWMKGYVGFGATDCDAGFIQGVEEGTSFDHEVLIQIGDIDRFIAEPSHVARMDGTITCARFGGTRPFAGGTFNMLVDDANPALKFMFYRIPFGAADGQVYTLLGHKTLHDDGALDLWGDVTTLFVRIFAGDVQGPDMTTPALGAKPTWPSAPIAMGTIHFQFVDGIRSARSFASPGSSFLERARAVEKFCGFYLRRVWALYRKYHEDAESLG